MANKAKAAQGANSGRKRRTREHVIADKSVNFVEEFIIDAGHVASPPEHDYGHDLMMRTCDHEGYLEEGHVLFQLKATDHPVKNAAGTEFIFSLDVRDYNAWRNEPMPVFLALYDVAADEAFWLYCQSYFKSDLRFGVPLTTKTVNVRIPVANRLMPSSIDYFRSRKAASWPTSTVTEV
jgi:hypothetical protein